MARGQALFVTVQTTPAEVGPGVAGDLVWVMAGAAPECFTCLLGTSAEGQLFDMADNLEPVLAALPLRSAHKHRPELLETSARLERAERSPRVQYPDRAPKVALLAHAVAFSRRCRRGIEYGPGGRFPDVSVRRAVAAIARDRLWIEERLLVPVHGIRQRFGSACMAPQALGRHRTAEVGIRLSLHAWRHAPSSMLGVVGDRRLEKSVAYANKVAERCVSRSDYVVDRVLGAESIALDLLNEPLGRRCHAKGSTGHAVSVYACRMVRAGLGDRPPHPAQEVLPDRLGMTLHALFRASRRRDRWHSGERRHDNRGSRPSRSTALQILAC